MNRIKKILKFDIELYTKNYCTNIPKSELIAFGVTLLLGFCIHCAALTNFFINEDSDLSGYTSVMVSGRPLFGFIYNLTESYPFQSLHTAIFLVLTSISGIVISKILGVRSTIVKIIIGTLYISYPAFSIGITYNFGILGYTCASLFAILAVFLVNKKGYFNFIVATLLFVSSLSIYQAYLPVAAALCLSILLKFTIENDIVDKKKFLEFIKKLRCFTLFAATSGLLYIGFVKICSQITGVNLAEYQGANKMGTLDVSPLAFKKIYACYTNLLNGFYFPFPSYFKLFVATILAIGAYYAIKKKFAYSSLKNKIINLTAVALLTAIMLILAILIPIVAPFAEISLMQTYGTLIVLFTFLSTATKNENINKTIVIFASLAIILCFTTRTNAQYYKAALITQASLHSVSRIFSRIEQVDGFSSNKKIAIIGTLPNAYLQTETRPPFTGEPHPGYSGNFVGLSRANQSHKFTKVLSFLGYKLKHIKTAEEYLAASRIAVGMPTYPQKGSIVVKDGMIVVRINKPLTPLHKTALGGGKYEFKYSPLSQNKNLEFVWQIYRQGYNSQVIQTDRPALNIVLPHIGETYCVTAHYRKKGTNSFFNSKPAWFIVN